MGLASPESGLLLSPFRLVAVAVNSSFRLDAAKLDAGIRDLVADIVRLQARGDYDGTKAFLAKYAVMDQEAQTVTGTMGGIPIDIWPVYPERI